MVGDCKDPDLERPLEVFGLGYSLRSKPWLVVHITSHSVSRRGPLRASSSSSLWFLDVLANGFTLRNPSQTMVCCTYHVGCLGGGLCPIGGCPSVFT